MGAVCCSHSYSGQHFGWPLKPVVERGNSLIMSPDVPAHKFEPLATSAAFWLVALTALIATGLAILHCLSLFRLLIRAI